jgi:prefoldin subunit 5
VPVPIASGKAMAEIEVIEETPSTIQVTMWDSRSEALLQDLMSSAKLSTEDRARLQPIVDSRAAIGAIDTKIDGLRRQQAELDRRANETRQNLLAIKQDSRAGALRKKLSKRLDEFTREADTLGRSIVTLNSERLEAKIALEDMLSDFDFRAPTTER